MADTTSYQTPTATTNMLYNKTEKIFPEQSLSKNRNILHCKHKGCFNNNMITPGILLLFVIQLDFCCSAWKWHNSSMYINYLHYSCSLTFLV